MKCVISLQPYSRALYTSFFIFIFIFEEMSHIHLGVLLWCWDSIIFFKVYLELHQFHLFYMPSLVGSFLRDPFISLSPGISCVPDIRASSYSKRVSESCLTELLTYKRAIRMKTLSHINVPLNPPSELHFFWGCTEDFLKKHSSSHRKFSCTEASRPCYYKNKVI